MSERGPCQSRAKSCDWCDETLRDAHFKKQAWGTAAGVPYQGPQAWMVLPAPQSANPQYPPPAWGHARQQESKRGDGQSLSVAGGIHCTRRAPTGEAPRNCTKDYQD